MSMHASKIDPPTSRPTTLILNAGKENEARRLRQYMRYGEVGAPTFDAA
ncbi:MAG: hypothetical protein WCL28_04090 [bacterium]